VISVTKFGRLIELPSKQNVSLLIDLGIILIRVHNLNAKLIVFIFAKEYALPSLLLKINY